VWGATARDTAADYFAGALQGHSLDMHIDLLAGPDLRGEPFGNLKAQSQGVLTHQGDHRRVNRKILSGARLALGDRAVKGGADGGVDQLLTGERERGAAFEQLGLGLENTFDGSLSARGQVRLQNLYPGG